MTLPTHFHSLWCNDDFSAAWMANGLAHLDYLTQSLVISRGTITSFATGPLPLMVRQSMLRIHYEKSEYRQDDGVPVKPKVDHIEMESLEVDNIEADSLSIHHKEYQKAYYALNILRKQNLF
ncbi:hypothetical protein ACFVSW_14910 [Neobacillus sp. NPDC058068]|uniref:hypothetical protein n=1 Tax=Neobacillus sp. NPDC058068 TaxID=3346325 RepID=UPI0036D93E6C